MRQLWLAFEAATFLGEGPLGPARLSHGPGWVDSQSPVHDPTPFLRARSSSNNETKYPLVSGHASEKVILWVSRFHWITQCIVLSCPEHIPSILAPVTSYLGSRVMGFRRMTYLGPTGN